MRIQFLALPMFSLSWALIAANPQASPMVAAKRQIETTADMREKAGKEFKEADDKLNSAFNKLVARLDDAAQKSKLREAERMWLKYRDANAEFEASFYEGGSIQPQIRSSCLTTMTLNRLKEIQHILETEFDR